jgi:hypothetical protein
LLCVALNARICIVLSFGEATWSSLVKVYNIQAGGYQLDVEICLCRNSCRGLGSTRLHHGVIP